MTFVDVARIGEVLFSIFAMHCILMDSSAYYRASIARLTTKKSPQFSARLASDINDALAESGL